MLKSILTLPNDILRKISVKVEENNIKSAFIAKLVRDLKDTLAKSKGLGIAAPQIGVLFRVIIVNTKDGQLCLINPKITRKSWKKEVDEEGCLSIPTVYKNVKRPYEVDVEYSAQNGEKKKLKAKGLFSRIIQHEVDHLDGVLFIDKAIT